MSPTQPALADAPAPRIRRGEVTRERILDAAERLFAERGFEGTTLRHVAARVGIRNPSLYNHFASKELLYAAVLDRGIRPVLELLASITSRDGRADSREIVERVMDVLARYPNLPRLVQHETLSGGQRLTPMLRDWIVPIFARSFQAAEQRDGGWDAEQIPLLVLAMYNVVVGYFAIAPLYADLNREDLLSRQALERQTRFLVEFTSRLMTDRES